MKSRLPILLSLLAILLFAVLPASAQPGPDHKPGKSDDSKPDKGQDDDKDKGKPHDGDDEFSGDKHGPDDKGHCGEQPNDAAEVAAARAAAEAACDCAGSTNHGKYVSCVAKVTDARVKQGLLRKECREQIKKCADHSTCGKEGFVTCCRTDKKGKTKCSIKHDANDCKAPKGGSACVGQVSSCCDACGDSGQCSATTTTIPGPTTTTSTSVTTTSVPASTTSTVSTTSTTIANQCGNGTVDAGETCDPPGSSCTGAFTGICQSNCQCPGATTTTSTISTTSTTAPSTTTSTAPPATTTTSQPIVTTTTTSSSTTTIATVPTTTTSVSSTTSSTVAATTTTLATTSTTLAPTTTTLATTTTSLAPTTTTLATTTTTIATTSTTLATTTTTSSTTSTTVAGCCGFPAPGPSELSFTTTIGSGNCGTVQLSNGTVSKNLACSGLYTGGGGNTVPLPYNVPDMGNTLTGVSACNSGTNALTLTSLTSAETGSNRNCSSVGCLFGAPLPIPNAGSTPTSVCVVNVVATNASGTANCATGVSNINLPLSSVLYLNGDLFPAAPGIQVCPTCNPTCTGGTNSGGPCNGAADCPSGTCGGATVCHGGPNDGDPCTPEDSVQGTTNSFPTSHDCPPPAVNNIGALPIAFNLTTGSTSRTAVNNAASGQNNVFCGYCRDLNGLGTGCFAGDPNPICPVPGGSPIACSSNAGCNADYPDCVQRSAGAFGPAGGGARTITETGSPAGDLRDGAAHASTLASIFCIQPTFNATVDAAGDLPGPGAVTLQGQAQLLP